MLQQGDAAFCCKTDMLFLIRSGIQNEYFLTEMGPSNSFSN